MTFFAKWPTSAPTDIMAGSCERQSLEAQAAAGEAVVATETYCSPDTVYVDTAGDGKLKRTGDDAVVEIEHLTDEMLAQYMADVEEYAPDADTASMCQQHLKQAQTITEAEAIIASYGITIPEE